MIVETCTTVKQTEDIGFSLASVVEHGDVIALRGGLGAGKTALCKGLARGLGVTEPVTSPTYTLINEYDGTLPLYHFDAYRLSGAEEFEQLDPGRYLYDGGVCAIEWSERVAAALPAHALTVTIAVHDDNSRVISVEGLSAEAENTLKAMLCQQGKTA